MGKRGYHYLLYASIFVNHSRTEPTFHPVNTSYHSVYKTAYNIGDILPHPTISEIQLNFPTTPQQIIEQFRDHLKSLPKPEGKRRVAVIDSIISNPGAHMPWQELVKICKEEGVWSVIDAAHSIGQEQKINLTEAAPDFWVSVRCTIAEPRVIDNLGLLQNCHKWLHAKRSVAMFYIPERYLSCRTSWYVWITYCLISVPSNRNVIKTSLPTSHAYKPLEKRTLKDFIAQWECEFISMINLVSV